MVDRVVGVARGWSLAGELLAVSVIAGLGGCADVGGGLGRSAPADAARRRAVQRRVAEFASCWLNTNMPEFPRTARAPWERGAAGLTAKTASATAADTTREKLAARERLKVTWPEKRDEEAVTRGTARAAQYVACLAAGMADAPPPLDEFRLKYDEEAALARLPDIAAAEAKKKEEMVAAELAAAARASIGLVVGLASERSEASGPPAN